MRPIRSVTPVIGWAVLVGVVICPHRAAAASGDADGTYTVTVTKVEMSKDGGTTYTTVFQGSQAINIASANAGAVAASLVSGVTLEPGVYNTVRTTLDGTMQFRGYVNNDNGTDTLYTDGGTETGSGESTSNNAGALNTPGSGYAASTYTIPVANRVGTDTGLSLVVEAGRSMVVDIAFDTAGTASESAPNVIIPGAPTITITSR
jgi:hypothetical protein